MTVSLVESNPNLFIDKKGLIQVVGDPYSGKTIFANFLSSIYPEDNCVWVAHDDAFSFDIKRRIQVPNDWRILVDVLSELEKCGEIVVIVDPIFLYEAGDERSAFFRQLKGFSGKMLLIIVNKIIYDVRKRIGGNGEKLWGGNMLSVLCDYIFKIYSVSEEDGNNFKVDIIKSYKTPPIFGLDLFFDNALLIKHSAIREM